MDYFNPILKEEPYVTSFFAKPPYPESFKTVHLLISSKTNQRLIIRNDSTISGRQLKSGKYDKIVTIDMTPHTLEMTEEVPSQDLVSKFIVKIRASVFVDRPDIVYENNVRDAGLLLKRECFSRIEEVASEYTVDNLLDYRKRVSEDLGRCMVLEEGITITGITVSVDMDQAAKEYLEKLRQMKRTEHINIMKAQLSHRVAEEFKDIASSVYADLIDEQIDPLEAYKRIREVPLKQAADVLEFVHQLEEKGLVSEFEVKDKVNILINQLLGEFGNKEVNSNAALSDGNKKNIDLPEEDDFFK